MGNAAEFGAERLPEEELPKKGVQTPSKASEVSEKLPVAVPKRDGVLDGGA